MQNAIGGNCSIHFCWKMPDPFCGRLIRVFTALSACLPPIAVSSPFTTAMETIVWDILEELSIALSLSCTPSLNQPATICGERLYIGGGFTTCANSAESVVMCEVKDLLQSQPQSLATRLLGRRSVWTEISPLPVNLSSLVTFQSQLLAVGGTSTV